MRLFNLLALIAFSAALLSSCLVLDDDPYDYYYYPTDVVYVDTRPPRRPLPPPRPHHPEPRPHRDYHEPSIYYNADTDDLIVF